MTATPQQLNALRAFNRTGAAATLIPDAVGDIGLETTLDGSEDGAVEVKGIFKDAPTRFPKGEIDLYREADLETSQYRAQTFTFAAAAIEFVPDSNTRMVANGKNYLVQAVTPEWYGETVIRYQLLIKQQI